MKACEGHSLKQSPTERLRFNQKIIEGFPFPTMAKGLQYNKMITTKRAAKHRLSLRNNI